MPRKSEDFSKFIANFADAHGFRVGCPRSSAGLKNDKVYKTRKIDNNKMALWFETKIRYDRMQENGMVKKVNEPYLVDALTFTDAEARIIEKITPFISGEFTVSAVKKTKISEIFFDESDYADKYYMVKLTFTIPSLTMQ